MALQRVTATIRAPPPPPPRPIPHLLELLAIDVESEKEVEVSAGVRSHLAKKLEKKQASRHARRDLFHDPEQTNSLCLPSQTRCIQRRDRASAKGGARKARQTAREKRKTRECVYVRKRDTVFILCIIPRVWSERVINSKRSSNDVNASFCKSCVSDR